MSQIAEGDEALRADQCLLTSVPGIGATAAHTLLAELGDLSTFTRSEIAAFAGLYPREHSSGTSVWRKPRLVEGGGARLRRILAMAAMCLRSHPNPLRDHTERLLAADHRRTKMQALGALVRKLLLVLRAVLCSRRPYDPVMIGTDPAK